MVSIGKADWYHKTSGTLPQQQPVSGARFSYENSGNGTLIDRLDAMGDGELHPNLNRNFDILA